MTNENLLSRLAGPLALVSVFVGPIALASMTNDILVWNSPIDGFVSFWATTIQPLLGGLLEALPGALNLPDLEPMVIDYLLMGIVLLPSSSRTPSLMMRNRADEVGGALKLIVLIIAAPFLVALWPLAILLVIATSTGHSSDTRFRSLALAPFLLFGVMFWFNEAWLQ